MGWASWGGSGGFHQHQEGRKKMAWPHTDSAGLGTALASPPVAWLRLLLPTPAPLKLSSTKLSMWESQPWYWDHLCTHTAASHWNILCPITIQAWLSRCCYGGKHRGESGFKSGESKWWGWFHKKDFPSIMKFKSHKTKPFLQCTLAWRYLKRGI